MAQAYKLKFTGATAADLTAQRVNLASEIALTANSGTNSLRVEIEFEVDSLSATNTLCFSASNSCRIQVFTTGSISVNYRNQNNFIAPVTSATGLISVGVRYVLALELSNVDRNARIFLDGVQVGIVANRWGLFNIGVFGLWSTNSTFNGSLYRVTCYQNGAIVNDYNPSIVLADPNILVDEIGDNNGTMVNFPADGSARVPYDDGGDPESKFSVLSIALELNQNYPASKLVDTSLGLNAGQLDVIKENKKLATASLNQILDLDYYSKPAKETRTTVPIEANIENTLNNKKLSSFSLPIDFSLSSELSSRKYGYSSINENLELVSILSYIRQDNPGAGTIDIRFQLGSSYTHKKSASTTYYTDLICSSIYLNSKKVNSTLYQSMALGVSNVANKNISSSIAASMELASAIEHSKAASSIYISQINLYSEYKVSKTYSTPYQINIGQLSVSLVNFNSDNKQPTHKVTILSNETTVLTVAPIIGKEIILSNETTVFTVAPIIGKEIILSEGNLIYGI